MTTMWKKIEWMKTRIVKYLISFMSWLSFLCMVKKLFLQVFPAVLLLWRQNAVNVSRPHIEQIVTQHTTMELSNNSIISWYQLIHISLALFTQHSRWECDECLTALKIIIIVIFPDAVEWMAVIKSIFVFGIHMWGFFMNEKDGWRWSFINMTIHNFFVCVFSCYDNHNVLRQKWIRRIRTCLLCAFESQFCREFSMKFEIILLS